MWGGMVSPSADRYEPRLSLPDVVEAGKGDEPVRRGKLVDGVSAPDLQGSVQTDMAAEMVVRIDIPFDSDGRPEEEGHGRLVFGFPGRRNNGPETGPGEGPEVPRAEILFADQRQREVSERPGAYIHLDASTTPPVFHDDAHEADPAEADSYADLFGPGSGRPGRGKATPWDGEEE